MDDSVALLLALASPELDVLGITTTHGNVEVSLATTNALKIIDLAQRADVPVAQGAEEALRGGRPVDPFSHGADGQAENHLPTPQKTAEPVNAVTLMADLIEKNWGEVEIICLGPMGNIATLVNDRPELIRGIRGVTAISGLFGVTVDAWKSATGDNPVSEWNVYVDPEAAKIVYESPLDIKAIGLDVATNFSIDFSEEQLEALDNARGGAAAFLAQAIDFVRSRGYGSYCAVIDALAVAAIVSPDLIDYSPGRVGISTEDPLTRGMTVLDARQHHVWDDLPLIQVATQVDYKRFLEMIVTRFAVHE